jgi:hypothetical protein
MVMTHKLNWTPNLVLGLMLLGPTTKVPNTYTPFISEFKPSQVQYSKGTQPKQRNAHSKA